ncbi:T9SS type A sorting domain-containing protein [candidate division KSB1 bacterium]|nr:T9SS type A sorting domain-containing protein [candidate division KSB1 bacterium]
MKKLLCISALLAVLLLIGSAFAQVTPIRDIQYTEDASGDSPLKGQSVTISGIVTAEPYAFGNSYYFVQDANAPWSGIKVYDRNRQVAEGDSVTLTGSISEYYGTTQISNLTDFTIEAEGVFGIEPLDVTTGEIATGGTMAEAYEGCLVRVRNVTITDPDLGYGEWAVDDGSGPCRVDDAADYYFDPADYDEAQSITGVLEYAYNDTKILPRLAYDIVEAGPFTRLQRIQQVRYSDLLKTPTENESDFSYLVDSTVTVKGVVTMPTGLSYAGAGIKFIFADPKGGPWSAILSYNADSTAYPILYEGDEIEMTGYIAEFTRGPSNMTEFFITSPIDITDVGVALPEPDSLVTGDLRWPTTAEQWGNVMVKVGNARVTNVNLQYELFAVDDGTGSILVDDDSDSLQNYPDPPLGTVAKSIRGWVYHHFGSYADSTTYVLEPLYRSDIVWGAGPPAIENTMRDTVSPKSSDPVTVTAQVTSNLGIAQVNLYYKADDGDYTTVAMTDMGENVYGGEIPAQPEDTFVSYYIEALDSDDQTSMDPADIAISNYGYRVTNDPLTIGDLQYTPWELADSPYHGYSVEVTGVVTADTTFYNKYGAYPIQDADGAWNGIFVFGALPALFPGDQVKVSGEVSDYNPDYHYKWDNNTLILADAVEILSTGNPVYDPQPVATGDLATGTPAAEQYEGVQVKVEKATLTRVNLYDVSIDDGSGECLLDADAFVGRDQDPNPYFYLNSNQGYLVIGGTDTLRVGDQISFAQGVFLFSFGTHKIEIRSLADVGNMTGVESDITAAPLAYALEQNYPNPFNPETRIYFEIPHRNPVKVVVYNVRGQQIRTLVDEVVDAGRHIVNWDGRDMTGATVPSGMYFYRIKAGDFIASKKMLLIK